VRIIARKTLRDFWESGHSDAAESLKAWFAEASRAGWRSMADVKRRYPHASVLDSERVVLNIGGNKYRLVVKIWFPGQTVWVKFVGTHAQYDRLDPKRL
jgi:mRNA interferase HigB